MDSPITETDSPNSNTRYNKRRRKKSMVWEHFTIETIDTDCVKACCNQCKKSFAYISGTKLAGTSHLKRHITLGICPVGRHNQEKDQLVPYTSVSGSNITQNGASLPRKRVRAAKGVSNNSIYFEGDRCNRELAKMIIMHNYPLHMVEHPGFVNFTRSLQPQFNTNSVSAVQEQIKGLYFREKQKILELLSEITGRLSLTVDLWTSNQSLTYALLTGHFVDYNWKLQRRVFNFATLQDPDSDAAFCHAVADCLTDWSFEEHLFTVTLDRSYSSESAGENIRHLLSIKNSPILNGQLLIKSCYTRILRSLAQNAIGFMRVTIEKVRQSVKHVKTSNAHEERFNRLKQQLQVPSAKILMIDDTTKWNSTYHMLVAASELKEVFSCLDTSDPDYTPIISMEEWGQVEILCTYLKFFYEAASILTSPVYPTSNVFFDEVCNIHIALMDGAGSQDFFVRCLTKTLHEKFVRYWDDCNLILAVAVVMDPRFKMKFVEFNFLRIYREDAGTWVKIVEEGLHELFLNYVVQSLPTVTFVGKGDDPPIKAEAVHEEEEFLSNGDGFDDFDIYISDIVSGQQMKSELELYLEEGVYPRVQDFDVLGWWKVNRSKYPTLAKLASDVLSIPLSTVPPECVFDTRDRKIESHHSLLGPNTLQELMCAKDWLRYESSESCFGIPSKISSGNC